MYQCGYRQSRHLLSFAPELHPPSHNTIVGTLELAPVTMNVMSAVSPTLIAKSLGTACVHRLLARHQVPGGDQRSKQPKMYPQVDLESE